MSGMLRDRKTPGVYVTELTAFPPSAVGLETAVPAFVGYTERADIRGRSVLLTPVRIGSLAEFNDVFGGPPRTQLSFETASDADVAAQDFDVEYEAFPEPGAETDGPLSPVRKKLVPTGEVGLLYSSLNLFYANGGAVCYIVSVGKYPKAVDATALKNGITALADQVGPTMLVVPDLSLLPHEGVKVPGFREVAVEMLNQCREKQDRVAIFDVVHAQGLGPKPATGALAAAITQFRADVDHDDRDFGIAYLPDLHTSILKPADIKYTVFERSGFIEFLLNEATKLFPNPRSADVQTLVETLRFHFRDGVPTDPTKRKEAETQLEAGLALLRQTNPAGARSLQFLVTDPSPQDLTNIEAVTTRDQNLTNAFPALTTLDGLAARRLNRLPASPAMVGVMTTTDSTRGVWNAPANIALNAVYEPTLKINNDDQADLNKPIDGKAINVVREFVGRGAVVWGARTLDGNSNDHRYVQVRRTLIYIEQSVKAALNQFVFAANDGKTWVSVSSMVSNFLHDLWAKGGLMGATPAEAFSVECGLGTTMTGRDVLEGYMVVQVLVQMVHPAEFIELTFKQKMEGVA